MCVWVLGGALARPWHAATSKGRVPAWRVCPAPRGLLLGIREEALTCAQPGSLILHIESGWWGHPSAAAHPLGSRNSVSSEPVGITRPLETSLILAKHAKVDV